MPAPRILALLLAPLFPTTAAAEQCTFGPCDKPCEPCGAHPGKTFCPTNPDGAQCLETGASWTRVGLGLCENQEHPYNADVKDKVPPKYSGSWGPDAGPGHEDRGYGWRFCGTVSDIFTGECKEFCDALGDCVAIAAGGCCFAYRARCGGRTDRSNSQSYVYYEMEMQSQWGWPVIAALALIAAGYVGGGLATSRTAGKTLGGGGVAGLLQAHPHAALWRQVGGLVTDGVRFARGGRGHGYEGLRASEPAPAEAKAGRRRDAGGDPEKEGLREGKRGKEPGGKQSKSSKRAKEAKEGKSSKRDKKEKRRSSSAEPDVETGEGAAAAGGGGAGAELDEQRVVQRGLHESQAKIKVVGLNG